MSDEETETANLAEARRRRAELHNALVDVEEAISGPAAGREPIWTQEVVATLQRLREAIEAHVEGTERPEGLYEEILHKAPRLADAVDRLRAEHPILRDATSDAIAKLRTAPIGTTWTLEDARDDLQRLLGRIVKHRQRGADLVWEAYTLDIGGTD